jgi:hypothetical protein
MAKAQPDHKTPAQITGGWYGNGSPPQCNGAPSSGTFPKNMIFSGFSLFFTVYPKQNGISAP